jgi:Leucine-rich repeat (LRR) protein
MLMGTFVHPYSHAAAVAALLPFASPLGSLTGVLELHYDGGFPTDGDMDWISRCPFLESLAIGSPRISDDALRRLRPVLPRLRALYLGKTTKISDAGLVHLRHCKSLETLSVPWWITDRGVEHLVKLTSLRWLNLKGCEVTDSCGASLAKLTNLRHLNLNLTRIRDRGVSALGTLRELRTLDLSLTNVTDKAMPAVGRLTKLEYLDLFGADVSDTGIAALAGLIHLRTLNLHGTKVGDKGLASLHRLRQLTDLKIDTKKALTDVGIRALLNFPELRYLDLSSSKISDDGMRHLANLRRLRSLDLSDTAISDNGLMQLRQCSNLRHLDVTRTRVTRVGFDELQRHLPKLVLCATLPDD